MKQKEIKLTTEIHKFMDIEGSELPLSFIKKLMNKALFMYMDTHDLQEHIYSIDDIVEKMDQNKRFFTMDQKIIINRIGRVLKKQDCGYFRFVFNRTPSPF